MIRITQSWRPNKVLQKSLVLLNYQAVVVLVELGDLLQLHLLGRHHFVFWRLYHFGNHSWRFEIWCLSRHVSLNVHICRRAKLFACPYKILEGECSTVRERAVTNLKWVFLETLVLKVAFERNHRTYVPFE